MIRPPSPPLALGALCACALAFCTPSPALASEAAGRRVLLLERGRDPFLERVGAEIAALGFTLVRSDAQGPLEDAARASGAVAAIRVLPSRKGVEVWMADSTSGRSLLRQVIVDESPGGPDRDVIALQTAELLRTSLLREQPAGGRDAGAPTTAPNAAQPPPAADGDAQPPDSPDAALQTRADSAVQLGFGALLSPGGATPSPTLGLSLQRFLGRRIGLGLELALPLVPGTIDELEGSAAFSAYFAGGALLLRLAPDARSWFANAGAGAAFLLVRYEGDTAQPLRATSDSRATAAAYALFDLGLSLASWLRLGVRALAGASFERMSVTFAGNAAGSYGPALLAGFVLAGMSFP
jgi:hypothetical protein